VSRGTDGGTLATIPLEPGGTADQQEADAD